jgi:hypothetical protein
MEGEEGDVAPSIDFGGALASAGRGAANPPPPGFRGEFVIGKTEENEDITVSVARSMYLDNFTLNARLNAIRFGQLLPARPPTQAEKDQIELDLATLNKLLAIRNAKDEAHWIAKDLIDFYDSFTPPNLPPPDENQNQDADEIQEANQNVAMAPSPEVDIDVDIA